MPKKSEFVLKAGAVITFFGEPKCYTNANMTDEVALRFLSLNPINERLFETLPDGWKNRINAPAEQAPSNEESEKDELIARLTAENEMLRKENEDLKATSSSKKRKKKSEPEAPAENPELSTEESATAPAESAAEENSSETESTVDSEVSVEDAEVSAAEE